MKDRHLKRLRRIFERQQTAHLWGQPHTITPAVVGGQIGDGDQLFWFSSIDTRPNFYVIRVPSAWVSTALPDDAVDQMIELIEKSFGNADWARDEDPNAEPDDFPAYHSETGCCAWGKLTWRDLLPPYPKIESDTPPSPQEPAP